MLKPRGFGSGPGGSQVSADWNALSGPSFIRNKPVLFSGAYADLTGKPTIPTVKRIETYVGTTDASGLITVTYPTPFAAVPNVHPEPVPSSDMVWVKVSSTVNGFSIRLVQRGVLTVLSLQVLAGTVTNVVGTSAQVLVVER